MISIRDLEAFARLHDMKKRVFGYPDWQTREARRGPNSTFELRSNIAEEQQLVVSVADANMNSLEDVQLRIFVRKERLDQDVTAILEVAQNGWISIARMDFWPSGPHVNKEWRRLQIPPRIVTSHHHAFSLNRKIGPEAFKPGNLDAAVEFDPPPKSFRDVLRWIEQEWSIGGASSLPVPQHQRTML
jgi:hypothetical protein